MKASKTIATALLAGLPLVSSGAIAQQQNYPGSMCVSASASPATVTTLGQARNNSATDNITVICPIVRDMGSFSTGNASGNVWVSDGNFNLNVCCSSRARTPSNGSTFTTASKCSTGVANNVSLSFSGPVVNATFPYRYYQCSLPALYMNTPSLIEGYRSGEL